MLFLLVVLQDIEPKLLEATSIRDTRDLTLHWSLLIIIQTKRFHPIGCLTYVSHHPSHEELCWLQVSYNIYILYVYIYIYELIYIYTHVVERETCHLSLHAVPSADIGRYFQDLQVVSQLQGSTWSNITRNWMQWGWSLSLYNLYFVLFSFQMFSLYIYNIDEYIYIVY